MKRKEEFVKKAAAGAPLSDKPDEAIRRLDNIRPREVSLVDSAANGRSFLIVKRSGDMKPKPKDAAIMKAADGAGTEQPAAQPATAPAPQEGAAPAAPATEATVAVEKGEFSKLSEKVLANMPVAKALAMEQKDMFFAMADALTSFCMGMDMIASDLMAFMGSDGKTGFMGTEVVKSALKQEFPQASEAELVEKAGKKMKKDRLMKLKQLRSDIDSLIKELDDEQSNENVTKGGTVNNQGKGSDQETNKSADGAAAAPATTATTSSEQSAAQPAAGLTAAQVEEVVQKAVKAATEPLQKEIEALKNAPAAPAGEGAEGTEEPVNKSADGKDGKTQSIFKGLIR